MGARRGHTGDSSKKTEGTEVGRTERTRGVVRTTVRSRRIPSLDREKRGGFGKGVHGFRSGYDSRRSM